MKQNIVKNKYKIASFLVLFTTVLLYKATDLVVLAQQVIEDKQVVYSLPVTEIPVFDPTVESEFNIKSVSSKAVYIEDIDSGTQLFQKNADRLLLPASTTKLMTALVVLETYDLSQVLTVPDISRIGGFKVGLFEGEEISVDALLQATLIQSSNDAAYILAQNHPEGMGGFVTAMNEKAVELGLSNTLFENPAGFDHKLQRSSARDLAVLSKEFMQEELLRDIVSTQEAIIYDFTETYSHTLGNTHKLLGVDESVIGIKTGTTEGASQVLITQFKREGRNILIIVMGSDDRYEETMQLIDWIFAQYKWVTPEEIVQES